MHVGSASRGPQKVASPPPQAWASDGGLAAMVTPLLGSRRLDPGSGLRKKTLPHVPE